MARKERRPNGQLELRLVPLSELQRWDRNPKPHDIGTLIESFRRYGFKDPPKYEPSLNDGAGGLVEGNGRYEALATLKADGSPPPAGIEAHDDDWLVPVLFGVDAASRAEAEAYAIDHNAITILGGNFGQDWEKKLYDLDGLLPVATDLAALDALPLTIDGDDLDVLLAGPEEITSRMRDAFVVPPFSVLDSRSGYWQDRKRAWIAWGVRAETGRSDELIGKKGTASIYGANRALQTADGKRVYPESTLSNASLFDPVLAEVAYRWFCPPGGSVMDPFAGECTKGLVSAYLGHPYVGVEVRPEQIQANNEALEDVREKLGDQPAPEWLLGDSAELDSVLPKGNSYDLVFTSPPYYDLEVYSSGGGDLSAKQTYDEFIEFYAAVFQQSADRLRDDRFMVVKVGEIRDKVGAYRNFVADTIDAIRSAGLHYYNEMILVHPPGSLHLRAGRYMRQSRKVGKDHQNVLVFYKGNPREINRHFTTEIECGDAPSEAT